MKFSPDGLWIATGGRGGDIRLWFAETDVVDSVFRGHTSWIITLTFSPNSQWIASGSGDTTVRLWDIFSGTPGLVLYGHSSCVESVAFSPCGQQIVSGSEDGTIRVWEESTGESRIILDIDHPALSMTVWYSSGGVQIALVREEGDCLELWYGHRKKVSLPLQDKGFVQFIAFSHCGQWIGLSSDDSLRFWKWKDATREWKCMLKMGDFLKRVENIAWRPGTLEFVTGTGTSSVQTWRLFETTYGEWDVKLLWSADHTGFVATDAVIDNTVGLSAANRRLLEQRIVRDWPSYMDNSDKSHDDDSEQSQDNYMVLDDQNDNVDEGHGEIQDDSDTE
ncbi:hypothetical protein BGZ96_011203 [Linnemannia gamsii]|uniref:WD40 repeat-like protein n=1 Tax=Linnemannia gamsii TaxID=64522 RepID=A0ABQ7JTP0_9FUNG|nr:hypothetical protein BGZ96_011203 [Linnemannia gamsii]